LRLWIVHSCLHLLFSLNCSFLFTPSVFSELFILVYTFGFLYHVYTLISIFFISIPKY
jgi:hypothetical protein